MFSELHMYKTLWHSLQAKLKKEGGWDTNCKYDMTDMDFDLTFLKSYKQPEPTKQELVNRKMAEDNKDFIKQLFRQRKEMEEAKRQYSEDESIDSQSSEEFDLYAQINEKIKSALSNKVKERLRATSFKRMMKEAGHDSSDSWELVTIWYQLSDNSVIM